MEDQEKVLELLIKILKHHFDRLQLIRNDVRLTQEEHISLIVLLAEVNDGIQAKNYTKFSTVRQKIDFALDVTEYTHDRVKEYLTKFING